MNASEAWSNVFIALIALLLVSVIGAAIYFGVQGANEAQRTGVERQQACVEAGGSFLDTPGGQYCIRAAE